MCTCQQNFQQNGTMFCCFISQNDMKNSLQRPLLLRDVSMETWHYGASMETCTLWPFHRDVALWHRNTGLTGLYHESSTKVHQSQHLTSNISNTKCRTILIQVNEVPFSPLWGFCICSDAKNKCNSVIELCVHSHQDSPICHLTQAQVKIVTL